MAEMSVEVRQIGDSPTSEGIARNHRVLIDRPREKGGADQGPLGGEMLLLSLGGCYMSNLIAATQARDVHVEGMKVVVRGEPGERPPRFRAATVEVHGRPNDEQTFQKAIELAGRACIVTNTLKAGIHIVLRRATAGPDRPT